MLILGGTGEARALAAALVGRVRVVSSLAGRVERPALPVGEVRTGGFGGAAGLAAWLIEHRVAAVVDATHPFAATMTGQAVQACARAGVAMLGLRRPAWVAGPGDRWHEVGSGPEAAERAGGLGTRVLLTTGRRSLEPFLGRGLWVLLRLVDPPDGPLPAGVELVLDRGPFTVDRERDLMRERRIDVVVTKNSGGAMTAAKLVAARELGLDVVVVRRPAAPDAPAVETVEGAAAWLAGRGVLDQVGR